MNPHSSQRAPNVVASLLVVFTWALLARSPAFAQGNTGGSRAAAAPAVRHANRVRHTALTAPPGTLEFGVLSASSWTINDQVELALHPLWFFVLPGAEAKVRWLDHGILTLSSRHSLSFPSLFLSLIARQGTGGLLDPTAPTPITFFTEHGLLVSLDLGSQNWLTLEPQLQLRLGEAGPLLDFPFLYQRFAVLNSLWVPSMRVGVEAAPWSVLGYEAQATYTYVPRSGERDGYALEANVEARWLVSRSSMLPVGVRMEVAQFPIGVRSHWFPYVDYRLKW